MTLQNVTVIIPRTTVLSACADCSTTIAAQMSRFLFPTHPTIRLPMREVPGHHLSAPS